MRRLAIIAALIVYLPLVPAWAQMRGGRVSGGSRGNFGGHISSGRTFAGGHAFGSMNRGPSFAGRGFSHGPSFHQSFRGSGFFNRGFRHRPRFRSFGFRDCFGCRRFWGWPAWSAGYYDPYWWWDSGSSYDEDREREIAAAREMDRQNLEEWRMRREEEQDSYARSEPQPKSQEAESPAAPTPATVLVFRDQHQQEVQNYAIVGSTLWVFGAQRRQKIPLTELDLVATARANDERGIEFHLPAVNEGQ